MKRSPDRHEAGLASGKPKRMPPQLWSTTAAPVSLPRDRTAIDERYTWNLHDIFTGWPEWDAACRRLSDAIESFAAMQGTLGRGPGRLIHALKEMDAAGQLAYKVWYFVALKYDEDQRDNEANARRQDVQTLLARWAQVTSWFNPELLKIPLDTVRGWMARDPELAVYRFAIEEIYRQQEHVLDEDGERILALSARVQDGAHDAYEALSTADIKYPTITLSDGQAVQITYSRYRALLDTCRVQSDRALAFSALHETFAANANTYAALYNAVLQRDWFAARARHYKTTLDSALFGNAIPTTVVENLIETAKSGVAPFQRYHALRRQWLELESYHIYDASLPILEFDQHYRYDDVLEWLVASVAPLGAEYQGLMQAGFNGRWIDVYENVGKRSGAYSAPVYGVHPYMLLNYNDTLDAVFTLAHEMGHSMHTLLTHEAQPFVYSNYTIFVAEVPSTLSEALLLEFMLARSQDPRERAVLLQHAIDGIVGTFYTQVLFADFELQAHRLVEDGKAVTSDTLGDIYFSLLRQYYGEALTYDELSRVTWARIPHFYASPFYVYQYATCYASSAKLIREITSGPAERRREAVHRYLELLRAGGSDHPITLLARAGVDLRAADAVQAVVDELSRLVDRLESELNELGGTA
jgi:oligoendopeptidase F